MKIWLRKLNAFIVASVEAYRGNLYFRTIFMSGDILASLVSCKSRVAHSNASNSILHLELLRSLLAAHLVDSNRAALEIEINCVQ